MELQLLSSNIYKRWAPLYGLTRIPFAWITPRVHAGLDEILNQSTAGKVLDLGAGTGFLLRRLRKLVAQPVEYLAVDASAAMLDKVHEVEAGDLDACTEVGLLLGDVDEELKNLARDQKQFDVVVSSLLLAHLDAPAKTVGRTLDRRMSGGSAGFLFFADQGTTGIRHLVRWFLRLLGAKPVDLDAVLTVVSEHLAREAGAKMMVQKSLAGCLVLVRVEPRSTDRVDA